MPQASTYPLASLPDGTETRLGVAGSGAVNRYRRYKPETRSSRSFGILSNNSKDNAVELDDAMTWLGAATGRSLYMEPGIALTSTYHMVPSDCEIFGSGEKSVVKCTATTGSAQAQTAFWIGYWAIHANGWRDPAGSGSYTRHITRYLANAVVDKGDRQVTLATAADAGNFTVGTIAYIRSQEVTEETSTGPGLELPYNNSLVRIISASAGTGIVTFETAIGFTTPTAPYLCSLNGATGAAQFLENFYIAQRVYMHDLRVDGYNAISNNNTGMYDCVIENVYTNSKHPIQANGMAHCRISGLRGTFTDGSCVETKFCSHDTLIEKIQLHNYTTVTSGGVGMFAFGERCRNIKIQDFDIIAPHWNTFHCIAMQHGYGCTVRNGRFFVPDATDTAINIYSESHAAVEENEISGVRIDHAGQYHLVLNNNLALDPTNNRILNNVFRSTYSGGSPIAIVIGGQGNVVRGNDCTGQLYLQSGSGNLVEHNIFGVAGYFGGGTPNSAIAICRDNYYRNAGIISTIANSTSPP